MNSALSSNQNAIQAPSPTTAELKLEVVIIPVTDVDRAKRFYGGLGWRLDADFATGEDWRVVQFTPPGSPCSIIFGKGVTTAVPGSVQGTFLIVSDIEAARIALIEHGASVSEVFHFDGGLHVGGSNGRVPGRARKLLPLLGLVQRSGRQQLAASGDQGAASWTGDEFGRANADGAAARSRGAPWRVWRERPQAPLVRVVRGLHHRA